MKACAGSGGKVGIGVTDGVSSMATGVLVCANVGVAGTGVTGKAVGTGPGGLITFFA